MKSTFVVRLTLASVVVASSAVVGIGVSPAAATPVAPYTDANATGYIGLCNQAGQQITSGSISATPFVWRAVSSVAAPAPYNNSGRQAVLNAYLPLQSLPPGAWSGQGLTAGSTYTNPSVPMAQATAQDLPLSVFLSAFPPKWDGFIQLRMYFGTKGQAPFVSQYPALNLYISGDTWTAVGGGQVNCNAGNAESLETVLLSPATTAATGSTNANGAVQAGSSSKGSSPKGSNGTDPSGASNGVNSTSGRNDSADAGVVARATASNTRVLPTFLIILLIVLVLAALLVGRELVKRWRGIATASEPPSPKGPNP